MKIIRNEKGITLVEVLAAMAILSIILISFMNFFPQMGMFNKVNADKTQGINIAKQVLNDWKTDSTVISALKKDSPVAGDWPASFLPASSTGDYYQFKINNPTAEISIQKLSDIKYTSGTPSADKNIRAHKMHIKVLNDNGNVLSETYGYVIVEKGDD